MPHVPIFLVVEPNGLILYCRRDGETISRNCQCARNIKWKIASKMLKKNHMDMNTSRLGHFHIQIGFSKKYLHLKASIQYLAT